VAGKEKDQLGCAVDYRTKAKPTEALKNQRRLVATRMHYDGASRIVKYIDLNIKH
jgi:hypothetical protein